MKFALSIYCLLTVVGAVPAVQKDSVDALSDSILQFSHKVYLLLGKTPGIRNFAFSPLSLHSVLTLLKLGATQDSRTELELTIALDSFIDINKVADTYSLVLNGYNRGHLKYGNHIWVNKQFKLKGSYINEAAKLNANVSSLDFADSSSLGTVNSWVRQLTNNKIESLVDSLSPVTQMVIGNAMYLKELWTNSFTESKTPTPFFLPEGGSADILMMERTDGDFSYGTFKILGDDLHEVIIIPYEDSDLEFIIILPNPRLGANGLEIIDKDLGIHADMGFAGNSQYENILKKAKVSAAPVDGELHLTMPRFTASLDVDVSNVLRDLGITSIFSDSAELSNLAAVENLRVDQIVQKAEVAVDLDGTEAAAASFVSLVLQSASFAEPLEVTVDRPFIFQVYDKVNNIPVFLGRVVDPSNQNI